MRPRTQKQPQVKKELCRVLDDVDVDVKNKEICMENVAGEQELALQHFPYKTSKFSENSNCRINLLFHSKGLHFGIFDARFPFSAFFKL